MKYVSDKDRKPFCADLKTIYHAPTEEKALEALQRVTEKWNGKYPVSYTHLDVYKRQGQGWLAQPCLTCPGTAL